MREGNAESGAVTCPFYESTKEKGIICERIKKGIYMGMTFTSKDTKDRYIALYCINYPERCKLHKALTKYYEEG